MQKKRARFSIEFNGLARHILIELGYLNRLGKSTQKKSLSNLFSHLIIEKFNNDTKEESYLKMQIVEYGRENEEIFKKINNLARLLSKFKEKTQKKQQKIIRSYDF